LDEAAGRPIVALSMQGRAEYKNYQHNAQLAEQLEASDVYCWSQFDGSLPMQTTLNRLNTSQLLVTVPTSTQWLARLAGCPSLILPGPMSPTLLDAEFWPPQRTDCQYCYRESHCPENRNFECMKIAPEALAEQVLNILKSTL
jgi:ADP-heptose:LPS heptosyltransferase